MRKKIFIFLLITIMLSSRYSSAEKLTTNAQSGILIEAQSGRILYEHNSHAKLPIASTTKVMTSLIALENGDLKEKVKIKRDAVGVEGSSIYLYEGEIITLEDLLFGLMLRSGNDAAMAIAQNIGGSVEGFVNMMNMKAKKIGANNTNFTNPHGLHHDEHYSTAYDLAMITREALKEEKFKEIAKTKVWKADRDKNNIFYNKNESLWEYEGGDGVKIGYTKRAGRCLVSSATRNGTQLISVVLNDGNWFNDCYRLFDYGFEHYTTYVIFDKGQYISKVPILYGVKEELPIVTGDSFLYPLEEEEMTKVKLHIDLPHNIEAPIRRGEHIGNISVYLDGRLIKEEKLIAREDIKKLGPIKRILRIIIK